MITTSCGTYKRTAWTGGDTPPPEFAKTWAGRELIQWFIDDQVADCGGMKNLPQWCFGDDTVADKLRIFEGRALLDAWRTYTANPNP